MMMMIIIVIIIIISSRCYVKANSFVQFLCPKFALMYVEFALTSSSYSYGINPIVGIRLNVEYMLVHNVMIINDHDNNDNNNIVIILIVIIMMMMMMICGGSRRGRDLE